MTHLPLPWHASAVVSFLCFLQQTIAVFIDHLKQIIKMQQHMNTVCENSLKSRNLTVQSGLFFLKASAEGFQNSIAHRDVVAPACIWNYEELVEVRKRKLKHWSQKSNVLAPGGALG